MLFADREEMETTVESLLIEVASGPVETRTGNVGLIGSGTWRVRFAAFGRVRRSRFDPAASQNSNPDSKMHDDRTTGSRVHRHPRPRPEEPTERMTTRVYRPANATKTRKQSKRRATGGRNVDDRSLSQAGKVVTDPETTNVKDVVDTAWEGAGGTAERATLYYDHVGSVSADADRLIELFENLFQNSIDTATAPLSSASARWTTASTSRTTAPASRQTAATTCSTTASRPPKTASATDSLSSGPSRAPRLGHPRHRQRHGRREGSKSPRRVSGLKWLLPADGRPDL